MKKLITEDEKNTLILVACGLGNKQIGIRFGIGETAVNHRIESAMAKLGANNRTHAVILALKGGYIAFDEIPD